MQAQTSGLLSAMDCFSEGIMLVNTATQSWDILFVNDAWSRITRAPRLPPLLPGIPCPQVAAVPQQSRMRRPGLHERCPAHVLHECVQSCACHSECLMCERAKSCQSLRGMCAADITREEALGQPVFTLFPACNIKARCPSLLE